MNIKEILRDNPLVLAPMAGITDFPFRLICRELGAGLVYSEMVSVEALIREHKRTFSMLHTTRAERPVAFQIFGSNPDSMNDAARILSDGELDFIDINMGCPVPKVLKCGAGSALLRNLDRAKAIMAAVVEASSVPVTIKIRIGWDANSIVAVEFAQAAESLGIAAVTVHGRTRAQGFSGLADWSMIKAVKEAVAIPVIGNGDVRSAEDAQRMIEETGCDGVMIGRGCQGNPWLFREARHYLQTGIVPTPASIEERQAVMLRHLTDMTRLVGKDIGIREMRKHLSWYTKGLPGGAEFRMRVNYLSLIDEVRGEIKDYFNTLDPGAVSEVEQTVPAE